MALAVWIALAFFVVAFVGSTAVAAVRGRRMWRTLRSFSGGMADGLAAVARSAAATEEHAVQLGRRGERLAAATERLQESLARLAVLRAAAGDVRATFGSVRGVVPRK